MKEASELVNLINQNKSITDILPSVSDIFNLIINQKKWVSEFYLHPLGFYYCRLFDNGENQIRLHIWEPGYPVKKDLFIHDHYYDLCSWVLCGKILDFSYSVEKTIEISEFTKFTSSYINGNDIRTLNRTDEYQKVNRSLERLLVKGEKYIIPKGTFHSNKIFFDISELTVTLVYTFNNNADHSPNVIGFSKNEIYLENNPEKITSLKVQTLIERANFCIFQESI